MSATVTVDGMHLGMNCSSCHAMPSSARFRVRGASVTWGHRKWLLSGVHYRRGMVCLFAKRRWGERDTCGDHPGCVCKRVVLVRAPI